MIIKHIPNTVTLLASFFGVLSVNFSFQGNLEYGAYCILIAAVCDFADGLLARLLNAKSQLGADLDSLADVVSFGVAPAIIAFQILQVMLPNNLSLLAYLAFLIVPFSALRLAIFNNSTNQTTSFVGLPVPAHAMLWVGLVFLKDSGMPILFNPYLLITFVVVFSLLLVSKLPLFSLKISKESTALQKRMVILFAVLSIVFLLFFQFGGLFFIVLLYALSGGVAYLKK